MIINLTAAARLIPLPALMLGACVSQSAYEKQGQELQQARAQRRWSSRRSLRCRPKTSGSSPATCYSRRAAIS